MKLRIKVVAVIASLGALAAGEPPAKLPPAFPGTVAFNKDIQPIFAKACLSCHNADKEKGGLRLDDKKSALAGGNSGTVINPGAKAAESKLLHAVAALDPEFVMPPTGARLSSEDISKLRAWIEQGAKWDETAVAGSKKQSSHWAFQPVKEPPVPALPNRQLPIRNPIDAFVRAKLDKENIEPAPEADKITLLRRLCLDLLGLPPTLEQIDEYIADTQPDAYDRLVDRLLASPHYGERWGRHWLDAARYADSDGYEKDTGRPWAWRYRDWVINALNSDLPYDRFVIEQIAGDLLPNATPEQKIATGFHRNTLTNKEGGADREQFRVEAVIDRTNTTGKVFLGLTVGCAQCHDHKYDPISQREYYQLFAFFNPDVEMDIDAPLPGEQERHARAKKEHANRRTELKAKVTARRAALPEAQEKWEAALTLSALRKLPPAVRDILLLEAAARNEAQKKALADHFAKQDAELKKLTKSLTDHDKKAPTLSQAPTLARGPDKSTHVLIRGDFLRPGAAVQPGTLAVLPPLKDAATPSRLDLARWIVDPANPLTRRVLANWLWQQHFGRGLVTTAEDFGTQGEKPSHPELLDWLAAEVLKQNWSLKKLHRVIVTSSTYRQSSAYRPELKDRDPNNIWLARQNRLRLEAESLRDVGLAASGLLHPTVGGPSVHPPQPEGISDLTYAGSARWVESKGPDRYRRGLYTWFQRTSPYPMLMTFDAPDSNVCTVRRERTNTPLQALTLLNDPTFVECAKALGQRMEGHPGSAAEKLALGFRLCVARRPTESETQRLLKFHAESVSAFRHQADSEPAEANAWFAVARVILNLDECMTRE